ITARKRKWGDFSVRGKNLCLVAEAGFLTQHTGQLGRADVGSAADEPHPATLQKAPEARRQGGGERRGARRLDEGAGLLDHHRGRRLELLVADQDEVVEVLAED